MRVSAVNNLKTLVILVLTGVFLFLGVKFFIADIARVDSLSMSRTMKQNDVVLVQPITFIMPGIKRNDVVQVSLPFHEKDNVLQRGLLFKRVIGLPEDTIRISHSRVFCNGQVLEINKDLLHNYILKIDLQKDTSLFTLFNINEKYLIDDSCAYMVPLTNTQFNQLKNIHVSIKENLEDSGLYDEAIFPYKPSIKWNKDFFGPLYIPKKNDTLFLDTLNIALYKKLITLFENNTLEIKDGKIIVNQTEATYYVPKQNYYFVIGDNFDNSIDSRQWGFVPEKSIRAKWIR